VPSENGRELWSPIENHDNSPTENPLAKSQRRSETIDDNSKERSHSQKVNADPMPLPRDRRRLWLNLSVLASILSPSYFLQFVPLFRLNAPSVSISPFVPTSDLFIFFQSHENSNRVLPLHSYLRSATFPSEFTFGYTFVGYSSKNETNPPNLVPPSLYGDVLTRPSIAALDDWRIPIFVNYFFIFN
jgi:hypothetical protein